MTFLELAKQIDDAAHNLEVAAHELDTAARIFGDKQAQHLEAKNNLDGLFKQMQAMMGMNVRPVDDMKQVALDAQKMRTK